MSSPSSASKTSSKSTKAGNATRSSASAKLHGHGGQASRHRHARQRSETRPQPGPPRLPGDRAAAATVPAVAGKIPRPAGTDSESGGLASEPGTPTVGAGRQPSTADVFTTSQRIPSGPGPGDDRMRADPRPAASSSRDHAGMRAPCSRSSRPSGAGHARCVSYPQSHPQPNPPAEA